MQCIRMQNREVQHEIMLEFCLLLEHRNINAAKQLITKDNINIIDAWGRGIVTNFCSFGPDDPKLLHHFLELGADIRLPSNRGWFPLHSIACGNKHKLALEMINLGIPKDCLTLSSMTPLALCFYRDPMKMTRTALVLLDAGAKLSLVKKHSKILIPEWARDFVSFREKVRKACVAILGLLKCRSHVLNGESDGNSNVNGMDVLRMISRCTWELRGVEFKCE